MTRTRMRDRHRSEWLICHLVCPPLIPYQQIRCRSHRNPRFRTRFFREPCPCPLRWTIRAPPLHPWLAPSPVSALVFGFFVSFVVDFVDFFFFWEAFKASKISCASAATTAASSEERPRA